MGKESNKYLLLSLLFNSVIQIMEPTIKSISLYI